LDERAVATLRTWKVLGKLRCCPRRATAIVQGPWRREPQGSVFGVHDELLAELAAM
jgi:hypothetical protein